VNFDALGKALVTPRKRQGIVEGPGFRFYARSCLRMPQVRDESIALTVTSPPYWNSIDYDVHAKDRKAWHREREYEAFGSTFKSWLGNIRKAFKEVFRATMPGGFCAIVVGTILHDGRHYPAPMMVTGSLLDLGWEFHQDLIWNKVTGGVKRAGVFIQHPRPGYFYPNIMTEYVLVFRKPGEMRRGQKKALDIDELFKRDIANNVWHIAPVPPNEIDHPCPYPEELVRRLVVLYSQEDDVVLDPFLGSGQTALVALREGRECVGYDVEEGYLELTKQRIEGRAGGRRRFNLVPSWEKIAVGGDIPSRAAGIRPTSSRLL
jgi:site-specific DNA-methyltransferase (adenine-specific)